MKTLIQHVDGFSLYLDLQETSSPEGVRLRLIAQDKDSTSVDQPKDLVDLHMSKHAFAILCRTLTVFSMRT